MVHHLSKLFMKLKLYIFLNQNLMPYSFFFLFFKSTLKDYFLLQFGIYLHVVKIFIFCRGWDKIFSKTILNIAEYIVTVKNLLSDISMCLNFILFMISWFNQLIALFWFSSLRSDNILYLLWIYIFLWLFRFLYSTKYYTCNVFTYYKPGGNVILFARFYPMNKVD